MYFMQEAGEPLRLKFKKAHYGSYSENLSHVLKTIEGYFISGYADGGDAPGKQLKLLPTAIENATDFLQNHAETRIRFNKVVELVKGFESPFGLELLATVHWIMKNERVDTIEDIVNHTYKWNVRKKQFTPRQIGIAADELTRKGWIEKNPHQSHGV